MTNNPMAVLQSENHRLREENEKLIDELRSLREFVRILDDLGSIAQRLTRDDEVLPLLNHILTHTLDLLKAPDGTLALLDPQKNELVFVLVHGALSQELQDYRLPADEGIAGWVVQNRQVALVRDARRDERFFAHVDTQFKFRTQSIAAAPLLGNERVIGVVEVLNQPGDEPFSDHDIALLKLLCRFAGETLANLES